MKNVCFLSMLFIFCAIIPGISQNPLKVKKIGIDISFDMDMVQNLSANSMLAKASPAFNEAFAGMHTDDDEKFSGICENPNLKINVVLEPTFFKNTEIHTNLNLIWNRWDGVGYYTSKQNANDEYYYLDMIGDEVNLEAVILKRTGAKWFHLYGGLGVNSGFHFNNKLYAYGFQGNNPEQVDRTLTEMFNPANGTITHSEEGMMFDFEESLSNGTSTRIFVQGGMGVEFFKRVELGINARYGYGIRTFNKGSNDYVNLISGGISLKYIFK